MALVSIVGTSGVGKSFLVKQLASLNCAPAFFEGEEGTIPGVVLEEVFKNSDPLARFDYFINRYDKNLHRAHQISNLGMNVYVDGGMLTIEAISLYEDSKHHEVIKKLVNQMKSS